MGFKTFLHHQGYNYGYFLQQGAGVGEDIGLGNRRKNRPEGLSTKRFELYLVDKVKVLSASWADELGLMLGVLGRIVDAIKTGVMKGKS